MRMHFRIIIPTLVVMLSVSCMREPTISGPTNDGNGSETVAILGTIVDSLGRPAPHTRVQLIPAAYDPMIGMLGGLPHADTTDSAGRYDLRAPDSGRYNIQAVRLDDRTRALILGINAQGDSVAQGTDTVRASGAIRVAIPDSIPSTQGYLYIPGTTIVAALTDHGGFVVLDSVPAGVVPAVRYGMRGSAAVAIAGSVDVASGTTMSIQYWGWLLSRRIHLNTTATGANVSGTLMDFPVLVRLSASNFNFNQARSGGVDIRFTKSNGSPLPSEIELWDSANNAAAIWVKVDTVLGNNATQSILMYWGASTGSATPSLSNSAAVFDTAAGFQGVWHLDQAASAAASDATQNHYNGTASGTSPQPVDGAIGIAQQFNGTSNFIEMKGTATGKLDFPQNGAYSVSAWVYIDALDTNQRFILGKGHEQYLFQQRIIDNDTAAKEWEFAEYAGTSGWQISRAVPVAKMWKYLMGVRRGMSQYLYIDGELADITITVYDPANATTRVTTNDFFMGKTPPLPAENPNYFKGMLDEVRAQSVACSADWIKLCYMNQKEPDALLKW
jgi:hypothetical protein